ncbi:MAG: oxidoreductase [Gammaproteobacteria bacterium]|nr:MAG: oxidoreductase [Gammaproteobacteria bacterium]
MSVVKVSSLHIYPIKSTAGISLPHANVDELGLAFDRRFVLSDPFGQFITGRTEPKLCLVKTNLTEQGLELSAANMPTLILSYKNFSDQYQNVTIWGDKIAGQLCSIEANSWFSDYLQRPCQLLFFGAKSQRERKSVTVDTKNNKARKIAFADGYPLLLISQASLDQLNFRLASNQQQKVSMAHFRPNIVVDNCLPFAEDGWQHIRIGEVEFKVSKPCQRCIFTTVNPITGEKHPAQQPLQTLKSFRKNDNNEVLFGQNLIALNRGQIKAGDQLTIISQQQPPVFNSENTIHLTQATPVNNKKSSPSSSKDNDVTSKAAKQQSKK